MRSAAVALACVVLLAGGAQAAELALTVGGRTQKQTTEALLAHPALTNVTVNDVSYGKPMTYRAVPASLLLAGVPAEGAVRFVAADGFAATIPAALLLATGEDAPRAYFAIEPANAPWPALKAGAKNTAGPFYLVWVRTERGRISPEQWPYAIARVEDVAPIAARFPGLVPAAGVSNNDPIRRGFAVFSASCLPCHTLNLMGDAHVGPDLNVPFSPIEYMREDFLRMQVRSPRSVRAWPDSKMPGFDVNAISEREMDDLLAYLYYMAKRKVELPKG